LTEMDASFKLPSTKATGFLPQTLEDYTKNNPPNHVINTHNTMDGGLLHALHTARNS